MSRKLLVNPGPRGYEWAVVDGTRLLDAGAEARDLTVSDLAEDIIRLSSRARTRGVIVSGPFAPQIAASLRDFGVRCTFGEPEAYRADLLRARLMADGTLIERATSAERERDELRARVAEQEAQLDGLRWCEGAYDEVKALLSACWHAHGLAIRWADDWRLKHEERMVWWHLRAWVAKVRENRKAKAEEDA